MQGASKKYKSKCGLIQEMEAEPFKAGHWSRLGYRLASRLPEEKANVVLDSLRIMEKHSGMPFGWLGAAWNAVYGILLKPVYSRIVPKTSLEDEQDGWGEFSGSLEQLLLFSPARRLVPVVTVTFFIRYGSNVADYITKAADKLPFNRF